MLLSKSEQPLGWKLMIRNSDISILMSPRTTINWAENSQIFNDIDFAFLVSFLNKCEETDKLIINEYYQRCFGREIINHERL